MSTDDQQIRHLIATWHHATAEGKVADVLALMAEDAMFLVAGQPPMVGRDAFGHGLRGLLAAHRIESTGEVEEVEISGDLAFSRTNLTVRVIPLNGGPVVERAGPALSVFRRQADGEWLLTRDANLLTPV